MPAEELLFQPTPAFGNYIKYPDVPKIAHEYVLIAGK
jgi:hypothetical protein